MPSKQRTKFGSHSQYKKNNEEIDENQEDIKTLKDEIIILKNTVNTLTIENNNNNVILNRIISHLNHLTGFSVG